MDKCSSKEQDTCNVEKMGCKGCYYEKETIKDISNSKEDYNER